MKIGMRQLVGMGLFASFAALGGCAAPAESEQGEGLASLVNDDADGVKATGETVSLNCGGIALPGFPSLPCLPDLRFGQLASYVVEPGGQLAPGTYIGFKIVNDSDKASGPFAVKVVDHTGKVTNTASFAGLPAHGSTIYTVVAPYACGWTRKAIVDSTSLVTEAAEYNNEQTFAKYCPR